MTREPLELHPDLDESLVEFWHGGEFTVTGAVKENSCPVCGKERA